jgi:hypothetical protein
MPRNFFGGTYMVPDPNGMKLRCKFRISKDFT